MIRTFFLFFWLVALTPAEVVDKAGALFDAQRWHETADVINENLPALRQSGDTENLAECLSMLSISYFRLGAFSAAWDAQNECYQIDLTSGDAGNISSSLNTLAGICLAMENYEEGERLIREAIRYEEPLGPSAALAVRYGMASDILLKEGKVDEAIDFATRALEMDTEAQRPVQTAIRQSQLAAAYIEAGRLSEAAKLLDAAAATFSTVHDLHSLAICRQQQGMIAAKQGDFRRAANFLREGLTLSRQTGELLQQRNISRDLAVVLKDTDPRSAVSYMQDVVVLSDTLFQQEMARKIAELSIQNDLARKEQEIAKQEEALKVRRQRITVLLLLLVLVAALAGVLAWLLHVHRRNLKLLHQASELKDKLLLLNGNLAMRDKSADAAKLSKELSQIGEEVGTPLTPREQEIALLCCEGLSNKEIANRINLSPRTVEAHKNNIFRKLDINSTAELVELMSKR